MAKFPLDELDMLTKLVALGDVTSRKDILHRFSKLYAEVESLRTQLARCREETVEECAKECDGEADTAAEATRRQEMSGDRGDARHQTIGWEQGARRSAARIRALASTGEKR